MNVEIRPVSNRREYRTFVHLPGEIHKDFRNWLPPVYLDDMHFFNHEKNPYFTHCDTVKLLAWRGDEAVGRIMGIINHPYNQAHDERTARFGFLECYDEQEVAHALISFIERWAKEKGMKRIIGPYGFNDKDPQGLMIEGFNYPPVIAAPCNPEYMVRLVENEGYTKEVDCLMYLFDMNREIPVIYSDIYKRVSSNSEYFLLEPATKKALRPYIVPVLKLFNEAYSEIYGFNPMEDKEMNDFASRYMPVLSPRFVKIVLHKGKVVACLIGLPNLTKGIQRSKGYLFPFGIFHLYWASRTARKLDLMLGGILPEYRGRGLEVMMALKLFESVKAAGFTKVEIHLVLETNQKMIAEMKRVGAVAHKRFRVFTKQI